MHKRIIGLRETGMSISRIAGLAGYSSAQIKRVTALQRAKTAAAGRASIAGVEGAGPDA